MEQCWVQIIFSFRFGIFFQGDFFQICKRDDPNLNECIKNGINKARPSLKSGMWSHFFMPVQTIVYFFWHIAMSHKLHIFKKN